MSQPFRTGQLYQSKIWPEIMITYGQDHLLLRTETVLQTVSSALWRGGAAEADHFVNWKVPLTYRSENPMDMMQEQIEKWGYPTERSIGLQTAAKLTHASIHEEEGDQFRMLCCATAGTGNAARAGTKRRTFSAYQCGTINLFLFIDGRMTSSAIVNALMTASEAKAAALQDLRILDQEGLVATGTTSDAIVLGCSQSHRYQPVHAFAGTATTIGNSVGCMVYEAVREAVATQGEP